ncbi:MAG: hypothetical protein HY820_04835 [Acidobacteria bacterium]|nr:hypothetical protein [Acidobacteriota bacterium]
MRLYSILLLCFTFTAYGQTRYHFGDNLKWADRTFDDAGWPQLTADLLPVPPYSSDGFLWIRERVSVPPDSSPLAVRVSRENADAIPQEVWINGVRVGSHGRFPPHADVRKRYATVVFDLPDGLVTPGSTALIAWRGWLPPGYAAGIAFHPQLRFDMEIGSREFMRVREAHAIASERLAFSLWFVFCLLETLLGLLLVILWLKVRGAPVLKWFSLFALLWGTNSLWGLAPIYWRTDWPDSVYWMGWCAGSVFLNVAINEFLGAAFDVPRWTIRWLNVVGVVWPVPIFIAAVATAPSPMVASVGGVGTVLFGGWLTGQTVLALWVFVRGGRHRLLAATFAFWGITLLLADVLRVVPMSLQWGVHVLDTESIATIIIIGVMCSLLLHQIWNEWRAKEELGAEFDAARSMQSRLVPKAVDVPGFLLESAYHPARQVGGDFFASSPVLTARCS